MCFLFQMSVLDASGAVLWSKAEGKLELSKATVVLLSAAEVPAIHLGKIGFLRFTISVS